MGNKWFVSQTAAKIGDPLVIISKGNGSFMEQFDLEIAGIYYTGNPRIDRSFLLLSYDLVNDYLVLDTQYNEINLYKASNIGGRGLLTEHTLSENDVQEINAICSSTQNNQVRAYSW